MSYAGDYELEDNIIIPFSTRAFATGIPTALVSGVIDIYEGITATPIITAETLTVSIGSQAGFNAVTIDATAAAGFEVGKTYTAILDAGTVDSVSVIGEVVGWFTISQSAAAIELDNATDGLTALRTLLLDIPTVSEFNARTILSASYFDPAADTVAAVTAVTNTVGITAAAVDLIWDELMAGHVTADSAGLVLNDWQDAGRLDAILDIIAADVINIDGGVPLTAAQVNTEVDNALDTALVEIAQGVPSATPTLRDALMLMYMALRNKLDVATVATDTLEIHNNAGTRIAQKLLTDDGSDYSEAQMTSGA